MDNNITVLQSLAAVSRVRLHTWFKSYSLFLPNMANEHIILICPMVRVSSLIQPSTQSLRWNGKPSASVLFSSTSPFKLSERDKKKTLTTGYSKGPGVSQMDALNHHLTLISPPSAKTSGSVCSLCQ